jgi:F420-0:gamma-glutamyl ligase-like protein
VTGYKAISVSTRYWKPNEDYVTNIIEAATDKLKDGDIVTVSEKAISTASGNIVDESEIKPSLTARFLAKYWTRIVWAYALGPMCHLRDETIQRLRNYPVREGARHKQVALQYAGFLQALMHGSEGGIDGSNLPYSYVSLALKDASRIAEKIRTAIEQKLGSNVTVLIVDTDKTFSLNSFHFNPRSVSLKRIHGDSGVFAYVAGHSLKLKKRATPIAVSGRDLTAEEALDIATIANKTRGFGAGRTVWEMAEKFGVSLTQTSWEMLSKIDHKPIVIVRRVKGKIFA